MALTITNSSLASGAKNVAYNSGNFTSSGGVGKVTWSLRSGTLPFGCMMSGNGGVADENAGATVAGNGQATNLPRWSNLVYPINFMKLYVDNVSAFPTTFTDAAWADNPTNAFNNDVNVIICYKPNWLGTSAPAGGGAAWPGGNIYPAQSGGTGSIQSDANGMIASIQALQALGLKIWGICLWQEMDDLKKHTIGGTQAQIYQMTYLYTQHYPLLHSALGSNCPGIGMLFTGYHPPYASATLDTAWTAGPTVLRPNDTRYYDWIGQDTYCAGYNQNDANGNPILGTPGGPNQYPFRTSPSTNPGLGDIAQYNNVGWGMTESGNKVNGNPGANDLIAYLSSDTNQYTYADPTNSMEAAYSYMLDNNMSPTPYMWYEDDSQFGTINQGLNDIPSYGVSPASSDFRIPLLQTVMASASQFTSPAKISGTPTTNGTYTVELRATDSTGAQAHKVFTIIIGNSVSTTWNLAGAGAVTPNVTQKATATPAGAGTLSAIPITTLHETAAAAGAGNLTALATQKTAITLTGAGALSALVEAVFVTAQISGSTSMQAAQSPAITAAVNPMSASGSMLAASFPLVAGGASGESDGAVNAVVTLGNNTGFSGAGILAAISEVESTSPMVGAGTLVAGGQVLSHALLAGAGALTDTFAQFPIEQLNGAGTLTAISTVKVTASMAGFGSVTNIAQLKALSSMAGVGLFDPAAIATQQAYASLAGGSTLSDDWVVNALATLSGAGTVANSVQQKNKASAAGAGAVTALFIDRIVAGLSGAGNLKATHITQATASLSSSSGMNTPIMGITGVSEISGVGITTANPHIRGKAHVMYGRGAIKGKVTVKR